MVTKKRLLIDLQGVNMDEVDTSDCTDVEDILSAVITYLSELPTVDAVEVVHGRWVYEPVEFTIEKDIKCSICGGYVEHATNYCPNCGAKMDKNENP